MSNRLQILLYDNNELVFSHEFSGSIELGRQSEGEEGPFRVRMSAGQRRLIIARREEQAVSRRFVLVEPGTNGKVRLTNLSSTQPLRMRDGSELAQQGTREVPLPALLALSRITARIQEAPSSIYGLPMATMPPQTGEFRSVNLRGLGVPSGVEGKTFMPWLHAVLDVLHSAASSADFLVKAARAAAELVNLDSAHILLRSPDGWFSEVSHASPGSDESVLQPSRGILSRLLEEKRTFWEMPDLRVNSLMGVKAVVAAPILNRHGEVIGALYGDRRGDGPLASIGPITELEASLVELLARGVAAGLARLDQERAALEARVRFEQFFTPQLARQLETNPNLLEGRDAEVSLLFCDIRGFSRISERLGPARTVAWISDTMATLSECVRARQGVLVDYIGDELIAMWGAPEEQRDHACLACSAALDMLACLPELNARWQGELQETMGLGIGVNTGVARVGNMGSPHKFKYGPLGNSVNLASRVQGATKYLKCPLLITGATRERLASSFQPRRLARVRVINIVEPVELYELASSSRPGWAEATSLYERALELFENGEFASAGRVLGELRANQPDDGPALVLLYRTVQCLVEETRASAPVWDLPGK